MLVTIVCLHWDVIFSAECNELFSQFLISLSYIVDFQWILHPKRLLYRQFIKYHKTWIHKLYRLDWCDTTAELERLGCCLFFFLLPYVLHYLIQTDLEICGGWWWPWLLCPSVSSPFLFTLTHPIDGNSFYPVSSFSPPSFCLLRLLFIQGRGPAVQETVQKIQPVY